MNKVTLGRTGICVNEVAMGCLPIQRISKEDAVNAMVDGEFGFHMIFDQLIDMLHGTDVEHMKQALGIS